MKSPHSQEQINELRRRLYDRGTEVEKIARHGLTDEKVDVSRNWSGAASAGNRNATDLRSGAIIGEVGSGESVVVEEKPKRHYRSFVLTGSILIFLFVAVVSSIFLYFGGNQISNDNILLTIQGQPLIGGGEAMSIQVGVTNQNDVPIESATLIMRYPVGTRSIGDSPRNLFEERISLEDIAPGEAQNIPVRVVIFGEENAEKKIEATLEYRIDGSNSVLVKDAEPLVFHISSSPLVLRIDSIEKVASGQLADITITAVSNASSPLEDILITASYPNGFDFEKSDPAPVYGENVWHIEQLLPEQSTTIKLQGIVSGFTGETFRINFAAGPASPDNQYLISAALADSRADFIIERPFIDVQININGDKDRDVIIPESMLATVEVSIKNTLDEAVYDMMVEVVPSGNALEDDSITSSNGFYDSNTGTVRWQVANNPTFDRVLPGDSRSLQFNVEQGPTKTSSSFDLVVNVYARRVGESSALENLIGTTRAKARYSSIIDFASQVGKNTAGYVDVGPVPPKVGEESTYTLTLVATAGANDVVNAVVDTSLPLYVNWLDLYDAEGQLTYNPVSKKITWNIGNIAAGDRKKLNFQVSLRPSVSQLDVSLVLLNKQTMRANDRFTGALLQDIGRAVTTELSEEMGYPRDNGRVVR